MHTFKQKTILFLATGGLIGFAPVAPGTFGSLAALPLCWFISLMGRDAAATFVLALVGFSIWIAHSAEKIEAQTDPKQVVVDEICGMLVTLFALPFTPVLIVAGFALFRMFDILKPFPIRWVDRNVPGGFGIVLDDLLAGVLANVVLRLAVHFFN
jgi:phosphatidylglycerophosphatase A